jgi:hydrogenase maturation protease
VTGRPGRVVVVGVGSEFRRDDAVGPEVVARLRGRVPAGVELLVSDGEPTGLIEAWDGVRLAVVVDAARAEPARPGLTHRLVLHGPVSGGSPGTSTHGFGLDEALGLAQALDRMPQRLVVHAVEAGDLSPGTGLTPHVAAAIDRLVAAVLRDVGGLG